MKAILNKLFAQETLSRKEARDILVEISEDKFNQAHLSSFLTVFMMRPITMFELQGFRDALLALCLPIDLQGIDSIDIVGTGGDSKNTFNISTLSSFVVAGAGYKVTKHGNYGVSSVSGSSNVLETLGYKFTNDQDTLLSRLDKSNIVFFHAPLFHPAMKAVGPVRKALGMKTFFNMLGPLVNPSRPRRHFLGVFNLYLSRLYQYILQEEEGSFAVVYDLEGYDEISLTGDFSIRTNDSDTYLNPKELGLETLKPTELHGGDTVEEAAKIFADILNGHGTPAQNQVVIANAGMAIQRFNPDQLTLDALDEARESLESGKAAEALKSAVAGCS